MAKKHRKEASVNQALQLNNFVAKYANKIHSSFAFVDKKKEANKYAARKCKQTDY